MNKIMILGASILQLPAIKKAKEMGMQVIVVDMNPGAVGFNESGIIKETISTVDIPAVVESAKKHHINGVITLASDMPVRTIALVAKEMGLVGIDENTALRATNKALMRQCLYEHGVPIPVFFKVSSEKEYYDAIMHFQRCFIVKPADNSGSRGIYLIRDKTNQQEVAYAYKYSHQYSRNGDIVVEEYMWGNEVSVEAISIDGKVHVIQITDKITTGAPHFVEMGHTQPSALPYSVTVAIKAVAKAAIKALGIKNGPSHTEIIVTPEGPKVVELGARLGGDCITTHLVPLSTGIDMVECSIRIALGEKPNVVCKCHKGSAIRYINSHKGLLEDVFGVEKAKKLVGVQKIEIVKNVGDIISDICCSTDRIGFVICDGNSNVEAGMICEKALNMIKLKVGNK